jgi:hypothetical protein
LPYINDAANQGSIKERFEDKERLEDLSVTETFNRLHQFIRMGGLESRPGAVRLGDWIDLNSLTVKAYGEGDDTGAFSVTNEDVSPDSLPFTGYEGRLLRLVVVGINSFRSGKGVDGKYSITANDSVAHVVFQFQNIPVLRRMNKVAVSNAIPPIPHYSNDGGYAASEMRKYLTPVAGFPESGKFLAGLLAAGVPEAVLWAPARYVSQKENVPREISDTLWLPTIGEMYEKRWFSDYVGELESNQARLEYYEAEGDDTAYAKRIKYYKQYEGGNWETFEHWSASAYSPGYAFCHACYNGKAHMTYDVSLGVAPAFCVW